MLTSCTCGICQTLLAYLLLVENPRVLQVVQHEHRKLLGTDWFSHILPLGSLFKTERTMNLDIFRALWYHSRDLSYCWLNLAENQKQHRLLVQCWAQCDKPSWQADAAKLLPASLHGSIQAYTDLSLGAGTSLNSSSFLHFSVTRSL